MSIIWPQIAVVFFYLQKQDHSISVLFFGFMVGLCFMDVIFLRGMSFLVLNEMIFGVVFG